MFIWSIVNSGLFNAYKPVRKQNNHIEKNADMKTINTRLVSTGYEFVCTELELHAYVDGELCEEERAHVLKAALQSPDIRAKLDELIELKEMMKKCYTAVKHP